MNKELKADREEVQFKKGLIVSLDKLEQDFASRKMSLTPDSRIQVAESNLNVKTVIYITKYKYYKL